MKIEGTVNPESVVCLFLAEENAFEIEYLNKTIRVGHTKGIWSFGKILGGLKPKLDDWFEWKDRFTGCTAENEVTKALIEQTISRFDKVELHTLSIPYLRRHESTAISEVLKIWAGSFSKIIRITILQSHRNSFVEQKSGKLILS